jgi:Response regulators consisting of a CheY-like receiver domain and a winged-helix DNA-binding domain
VLNIENSIKILLCDDSIAVHESLTAYLTAENMKCFSVFDGEQALSLLKKEDFDLIILDIMLPKMFGTCVCKEIRKTSEVPIIMLSAKGEEEDRILGLELGADDYVTKPFSPREVITRIKTILKRVQPQNTLNNKLTAGELTINTDGYEVYVRNERIEMTPKEVEILAFMVANKGRVLSREHLLNKVWGYDYYGDIRAVDTQIKRLRQKLPEEGVSFEIKAIYGVGYKFEVLK